MTMAREDMRRIGRHPYRFWLVVLVVALALGLACHAYRSLDRGGPVERAAPP